MAESSQATTIAPGRPQKSPEEIFAVVRARESALSHLLMAFVGSDG